MNFTTENADIEEEEVICFVTSKIFCSNSKLPGSSVDHLGPCNLKSISTLDQSLEREKLVP